MMHRRHIRSHTALRGIAALLVVLYHYRHAFPWGATIDGRTGFVMSATHMVDLFFMLSGFVMTLVYAADGFDSRFSPRDFLQSRFARIYPLHLLTLAWMSLLVLYGGPFSAELSQEALRTVALVQAWGFQDQFSLNFPSWSISGEFAAYLLFPLLGCGLLMRLRPGPEVFVVLAIAGLAAHEILMQHYGLRWERIALLRAVPGFLLGYALCHYRHSWTGLSDRALSLIQLSCVVALAGMMHARLELLWMVPLFAICILSTWEDRGVLGRLLSARAPVWLGDISYTIYMLHVPVISTGYLAWPKLAGFLPDTLRQALFVPATLLVTLGLSALVYRHFEVPMRSLLRARQRTRAGVD